MKKTCSICKNDSESYDVVDLVNSPKDGSEPFCVCRSCAWSILKRCDAQERKERSITIDPITLYVRTSHDWVTREFAKWVEESNSPWFESRVACIDVCVSDKGGLKEICLVPLMSG